MTHADFNDRLTVGMQAINQLRIGIELYDSRAQRHVDICKAEHSSLLGLFLSYESEDSLDFAGAT